MKRLSDDPQTTTRKNPRSESESPSSTQLERRSTLPTQVTFRHDRYGTSSAPEPPYGPLTISRWNSGRPPWGPSDFSSQMSAILTYAHSTGQSVAIATGYITDDQMRECDPFGHAVAKLTPEERLAWDIYCESLLPEEDQQDKEDCVNLDEILPQVPDWTLPQYTMRLGNTETSEPSSKVVRSFERRAKALNFLYGENVKIGPENAKWFTLNHLDLLPLVKAIDKVLAAIGIMKWDRSEALSRLLRLEILGWESMARTAEDFLQRQGKIGIRGGLSYLFTPNIDYASRRSRFGKETFRTDTVTIRERQQVPSTQTQEIDTPSPSDQDIILIREHLLRFNEMARILRAGTVDIKLDLGRQGHLWYQTAAQPTPYDKVFEAILQRLRNFSDRTRVGDLHIFPRAEFGTG